MQAAVITAIAASTKLLGSGTGTATDRGYLLTAF
jgi:hypothetical protein